MESSPPQSNVDALQRLANAVEVQLQHQNQQQAQQIGEMHKQLLAMQQEMHSLRLDPAAAQQRASAAVVEHARPRSELLRAAKRPECFRGEHGGYALNWLQEMDIFLENCESPPSESQKITLAKSFLRDEALHWWCAREKNVQRALASGDASLVELTPAITTWSAFQSALTDYFCPRGASDEARNELHRLRQNQFRSLEAYADRFEAVGRRIEVPMGQSIEEELIATFKAGLMDGLIRLSLTNTRPRTLFQAIQQAHQAESDLRVAGTHATSGRFDSSRRMFGTNSNPHRFDRVRPGDFRSSAGPSHGYSSHTVPGSNTHVHRWSHSNRSSATAVPMDLSSLAAVKNGSGSDSDREPEDDHSAQVSRENQDSPSSAGLSAENRSPQSTPEFADEFTCSSCQLNAAQVQRASEPSRCQKCGQRTQRQARKPSECWNCGQIGHLSRDCLKPHRQAGSTSGNSQDARGKPRYF